MSKLILFVIAIIFTTAFADFPSCWLLEPTPWNRNYQAYITADYLDDTCSDSSLISFEAKFSGACYKGSLGYKKLASVIGSDFVKFGELTYLDENCKEPANNYCPQEYQSVSKPMSEVNICKNKKKFIFTGSSASN